MKTLHKRQVGEGMKTFKYLPIVALCVFGLLGIAACKHETTGPEIEEVVFPRLKIISTETDSNDFVLTPISENVKLQQQSWGDHSNDDVPDPWYEKCEIMDGDDNLIGSGQVKVRGNWTTTYPKKSLRIKFDDKQSMLGLNNNKKFKNWVLLALYKDASFLRDAVAFEMYHKMFSGYASDSKLVELEVNGTYMGVYLLAEQQEAKRLGLTEPEKNATNTDIGYLLEFDSYYSFEAANEQFEIYYIDDIKDYAGTVMQDVNSGYTIKSDITNVAQHDFIRDYMNRLWYICYEAVYNKQYYKFNSSFELEEWTDIPGANDNEKCKNCVQAVIDLGSLVDTYVFNELVCDPDLYYSSFFMSLDFAEGKERKLTFSAPWDFDSTMGNKSFCIADTSNEDSSKKYIRHINEMHAGRGQANVNCEDGFVHGNPWMMIFVNQAWFQDMVKTSWAGVKAKNVLPELVQFIDARSTDALQVAYNATRDNELWRDADEGWKWELCTASKNAEAVSQKASADYLKEWLTARFTAVDSIITNMTPHSF